jgi:hypothetical protein
MMYIALDLLIPGSTDISHMQYLRTARLTFYGGRIDVILCYYPIIIYLKRSAVLFGPIMTKWYQWLGDLHFKNPVKAIAVRVRFLLLFLLFVWMINACVA